MKKLLSLFMIICFGQVSFAQIMAADIGYQNISGNTYKITIHTFSSTLGTFADQCELVVYFGTGDSVIFERVNGPSLNCPGGHDGVLTTGCNSSVLYSVYEDLYTYPGPGTYNINVQNINRLPGIANIVNSQTTAIPLHATLVINPLFGANNSPIASNGNYVLCNCVNSPYSFNPGFFDSDGDSLYYQNSLAGTSGYTNPAATGIFSINNSTGDVTWNNPTAMGKDVFDITMSEWRLLGGTRYYTGSSMLEAWTEVSVCTGINEQNAATVSVTIFPNPATDVISFSISDLPEKQDYYICIYNELGQSVSKTAVKNALSKIDLHGLPSGMYFYRLSGKNTTLSSGKFIISGDVIK